MSGDHQARRHPAPRGLPRGRASLPPEASAFLQRARILDATARTVAELGYADATVGRIQTRAGVSRRTFYAAYGGKQAAVIAAFESAVVFGGPQLIAAYRSRQSWPEAVDAVLTLYLRLLGQDRDWASLCLIGIESAGERAMVRRERLMASLASTFAPTVAAEPAMVGAVAAVHHRLRASLSAGDAPLVALRSELLTLVFGALGVPHAGRGQRDRVAPVVTVRSTRAPQLRRLVERGSPEVLGELQRAVDERDGPALWLFVLAHEHRGGGAASADAYARALAALDGAWFFGLPVQRIVDGDSGPWMPTAVWLRCLAYLDLHPDCTVAELAEAVGRTHHAGVYRVLNRLRDDGLAERRSGPSRAAIWRCTAAGQELLNHRNPGDSEF